MKRKEDPKKQRGFTLIEVMITLIIVGGMIAVIIPRLGGRRDEIKTALRNITVLVKGLHNDARLKGKTYRLVIKMDKDKSGSYYVESTTSKVPLKSQEEREALEKKKKDLGDKAKGNNSLSDGFSSDGSIMKGEKALPRDFLFEGVEQADLKEQQDDGLAYIYFFPQGLVQESIIKITDKNRKMEWSIYITPLSGEARIYNQFIRLSDVTEQ